MPLPPSHRPLPFLTEALEGRRREGLLREPLPLPYPARSFSSNDYLGFAHDAVEASGPAGAGASRLVAGDHAPAQNLESALGAWLGLPGVLLFTSGYAANVGTVSALATRSDRVLSDAMNHASLIDGLRLSGARNEVFPHNDLQALEALLEHPAKAGPAPRRTFVVAESYYSMDADGPDLRGLRDLCDAKGAVLVLDETHALGVFGPQGRGLAAAAGVVPDVLMGALGKAFGVQGGFAAGAPELRAWLWNAARSFVYSTGISPLLATVARARLAQVQSGDALRENLTRVAHQLRHALTDLGVVPLGHGPIVPWVLGDEGRATALAAGLREQGFHVQAIRPPTVPPGTSRLRLTVTARHTHQDILDLASAIRRTLP